MRQPNFFIVGGPKCGTTAIWSYLREHPQVFMCEPKEPSFFASDSPLSKLVVQTIEEYQALFDCAESRHLVVGEASVLYLSSSVALTTIRDRIPDAKLLVMFRNPVDAYLSYHRQLLKSWLENEPDPLKAWRLQGSRRIGQHIPQGDLASGHLEYKQMLSFGEQLQRLLSNYPRERVHIEFFDDFKRDPREVYERVLGFLGLASDNRSSFLVVNERWHVRFPMLHQLWNLYRVPMPIRSAGRRIGLRRVYKWIHEKVLVTTDREKRPLPVEFRHELLDAFRDDILLLQEITGRDLAHWLEVNEARPSHVA